jgi:hypothetical protein
MAFPYICKNTSNCFFGLFQSLDQQLLKFNEKVETYLITLASNGNKQLQWTRSKNKWYDITTMSKVQRNNNKIWKQMDQLVVNQMHKAIWWKKTHGNSENGKEQEILC